MKKLPVLLIFAAALTACDPQAKELQTLADAYNAEMTAGLEKINSSVSENSQLDIFPFYYKGADVSYVSGNEEALKVGENALSAVRKPYSDVHCLLTATLTLGEATASFTYPICILASEQKLLDAPTVQLLRNDLVVDGFYLDGFTYENGDRLRLVPPVGASCLYTLDGSNPHESQTAEEALTIDLTETGEVTLKAAAVRDGYLPSPVINVNGYVLGKAPSLTVTGINATVKVSQSQLKTWAQEGSGVFYTDGVTAVPEETKAYFDVLKNERFADFYSDYYVLNYLDHAAAGHEWPAAGFKDTLFASLTGVTTDTGIEDAYIVLYLVEKAGFDAATTSETPFVSVNLAVVDLNGTPSEVAETPLFLTDDSFSYEKRLLFDSEQYLSARGRGEKSVYVDAVTAGCGIIEEALMETIFPHWGDYIFSPDAMTVIVKFKQTGGDADSGLRAVFSWAAATESKKYLATYFNSGFTQLGYEWIGNNGNSAKANLLTSVSGTDSGIFLIQTVDGTSTTAKWCSVSDSNFESLETNTASVTCAITPSDISYRSGSERGKFALGSVNRWLPSANTYWRTKGYFHARVYEGVLDTTDLTAALQEMTPDTADAYRLEQ